MKIKNIILKSFIVLFCLTIIYTIQPKYSFSKNLEFSITDYLQKVKTSHPDQKVNSYDTKESLASYHEIKYSYSPLINLGYNHINNNVGEMNMFPYKSDIISAGISKRFAHTGTSAGFNFVNNNMKYDSGMSPVDTWKSSYEFSIMQPILRNGPLGSPNLKQLDILKEQVKLSRSIYNSKLEGIIFQAFSLYWQIQLNIRQLELTEGSLKDSKQMLDKNRKRVKLGTVDIDEVYDFEASYIRTKADYENLKREYNDLKKEFLYTLSIENTDLSNINIKLKDNLILEQYQTNREIIYKNAQNNRKDLKQARLQEKMAKLNLDIAKVTMLPSLDFTLASKFQGDDNNRSDLPRAIKNIKFTSAHHNLSLGLQFQIPIDFRALKVVKEKAEVNYSRSHANINKLNHEIQKDIDKLIREVNYYWNTEKAYKKTVQLMEKKLKQYKKKYYNGKIDSNYYVKANDDLRMWQKTHLATLFQYKLAKARLEIAQAIFLKNYGINELKINNNIK